MAAMAVTTACAGCAVGALAGIGLLFNDVNNKMGDRDDSYRGKRRKGGKAPKKQPIVVEETSSSSEEEQVIHVPSTRKTRTVSVVPQEPAQAPMEAGWEGFSMEDARKLADAEHQEALQKTPQDVLADLQKGNVRFWTGQANRPEKSIFQRRALMSKQFPLVAILSCADSRVPAEIVFDQGLGDMFVVRVAGNCLDTASLASLQYAINHLKVKLVLVMGHEACGAVKAAGLPADDIAKEPQALGRLLNSLKGGLDHKRLESVHDTRSYDREAVVTNVRRQIEQLSKDDGIMAKINNNDLMCVGGFYQISSGIVDFFSELSAPPPATEASPTVSEGSVVRVSSGFGLAPTATRGVSSRLQAVAPSGSQKQL